MKIESWTSGFRGGRTECDGIEGKFPAGIQHTLDGLPCLTLDGSDKRTRRAFRVSLTPEETEAVARIFFRSGAFGMNKLRAKFEQEIG